MFRQRAKRPRASGTPINKGRGGGADTCGTGAEGRLGTGGNIAGADMDIAARTDSCAPSPEPRIDHEHKARP
eukprot:scaffold31448_cov33-Tisochrysis_lutea.AAC.2